MPFQFGTNWSRFSDAAANVISPMLACEDLMAFSLEASFLGILLFGATSCLAAWQGSSANSSWPGPARGGIGQRTEAFGSGVARSKF